MCFATTNESTSKTTQVSPALAARRMPSFNPSYSATLFDARPIDALHHACGSPLSPGFHTAVPCPAFPSLSPCARRLAPSDLYRTARPIDLGGRILLFLLSFFVEFVAHPVSHGQSSNSRIVGDFDIFSYKVKLLKFQKMFIKIGEFWTTIAKHIRNFENDSAKMRKCLTKVS